jgi:DNA-binding MarR family transcriptional regulator
MGKDKKDLMIQMGMPAVEGTITGDVLKAAQVKRAIALAAKRATIAGEAFGAHPAWEILMQLSLAECTGQLVCLRQLSASVHANPSTLARIMNVMATEGSVVLCQRDDDTEIYAELTEASRQAIADYFQSI